MRKTDIDTYVRIKKAIPYFKKYRIRRGHFHKLVFGLLKLKNSKKNIRLLKAALVEYDVKEIAIDGYPFYKFGKEK